MRGYSYPGVLVHAYVNLFLRWRLDKHLIPLTGRVTAQLNEEYWKNETQIKASLVSNTRLSDFSTYCSKLMYLTTVVLESSTQMPQMSVEVRTKSTKVS